MRATTVVAIVLACVWVFLPPSSARGQSYGTELPFVLGTSARSSAMGVTSVGFAPDASIQYYNPSLMSSLQWKQFVFSRTTLFESSSLYHTISYAHPLLNYGTIGVSMLRVDVGGIESRDASNQLISSDLHDAQTRVLVGYGRNLGSTLSAGFNLVFDNHSFGSYSGSGIGLDVGVSAQHTFGGWGFLRGIREGFVIRNIIEPSVKLDQESVDDPMSMGLGLSVLSALGNVRMITTLDLASPRYSPTTLRFGQEFTYAENYSLRVGVDKTTPTFGAGAIYKNFALDYAFRSEEFGDNHRMSLAIRFGASIEEQRDDARYRREQEINAKISAKMSELEAAQIHSTFAEGKRLLSEGDYNGALGRFEATLLWSPDHAEAKELAAQARYGQSMVFGRSSVEQQDYAGAIIYFKHAARWKPGDTEAATWIAICEERLAAEVDRNLATRDMLNRAIDLYAERQFIDALSAFNQVLRLDGTNELAREYAEKCQINIDGQVQRYLTDAKAAVRRRDYDSAIRTLSRALSYQPQNTDVQREMARVRELAASAATVNDPPLQGGEPEQGASGAQVIDSPALERAYNAGLNEFNKGNYTRAIDNLSKVWAQDPQLHNVASLLVKAYLFVGMNYYSDQNYAAAIRTWERALAVDPDNDKVKRYIQKANEIVDSLRGEAYGN